MTWAQGRFTLQGDASSHVIDAHPIFKLHLFLGMTILLIFPFTRLVHMLSAPVRYIWRPGYQIVRSRRPQPTRRLRARRSEEHTSELQSLMRSSYAVFCLKKKKKITRLRN